MNAQLVSQATDGDTHQYTSGEIIDHMFNCKMYRIKRESLVTIPINDTFVIKWPIHDQFTYPVRIRLYLSIGWLFAMEFAHGVLVVCTDADPMHYQC